MSRYKPVPNPMPPSEAARRAKTASPWSRGPHCHTTRAAMSHARYVAKRKSR
jgi:hypothetical protein